MSLFLCFSGILLGQYWWKSLVKCRGFGKNIKKGMAIYWRVVYRRGFKLSAHYDIGRLKGGTLEPWITEGPKLEDRGAGGSGFEKWGSQILLHTMELNIQVDFIHHWNYRYQIYSTNEENVTINILDQATFLIFLEKKLGLILTICNKKILV